MSTFDPDWTVAPGYCACGCGGQTSVARRTDRARGVVKGQLLRWIRGHGKPHGRHTLVLQDRGYLTECLIWPGSVNERGYGKRYSQLRGEARGMSLQITVYGRPEPAGSKRAFVNPKTRRAIVTDANSKAKPWKQEVAGAAVAAIEEREINGALVPGRLQAIRGGEAPVRLQVEFYLRRPVGHYGTGRNTGTLKRSAPTYPATRPDATKLLRAVEDALTGIVWRDDAQVVDQHVLKLYADGEMPEGCRIFVREAA